MATVAPRILLAIVCLLALPVFLGEAARAHCDTLDGPVIQDARRALESGDLAPVLKWIAPADVPAVRDAFGRTSLVRTQSEPARELADRYFFETVVRIHRAGEGAPYEGLKPAGSISPTIAAADQALVSGSPEKLARDLSSTVGEEVRKRFRTTQQLKAHAEESPEAGRAFVAAYVDYVHFVEGLDGLLEAGGHAHAAEAPSHAH
jgi:hypothetical protein